MARHFDVEDSARPGGPGFKITIHEENGVQLVTVRRARSRTGDTIPLDAVARMIEMRCAQARVAEQQAGKVRRR